MSGHHSVTVGHIATSHPLPQFTYNTTQLDVRFIHGVHSEILFVKILSLHRSRQVKGHTSSWLVLRRSTSKEW